MEIYNKSTPYNINDVELFSEEQFNTSNLLYMRNYYDKEYYYSISLSLVNTNLSEDIINNIKILLINPYKLKIKNDHIVYISTGKDKLDCELKLINLVKNIFKILFQNNYITKESFFAISYYDNIKTYTGILYTTTINF